MQNSKIVLALDREDALWLYADINKRRQSVPGVKKLLMAAAKGRKFKEQLEKLQSDDEHMRSLAYDIGVALAWAPDEFSV